MWFVLTIVQQLGFSDPVRTLGRAGREQTKSQIGAQERGCAHPSGDITGMSRFSSHTSKTATAENPSI